MTDTPENVARVTRYISSIPVLEPRRTTRIIYLDHQTASSVAGKLEDFLDIEIRGGESSSSTSATASSDTSSSSEANQGLQLSRPGVIF